MYVSILKINVLVMAFDFENGKIVIPLFRH